MKLLVAVAVLFGTFSIGLAGCSKEQASVKQETKTSTDGGTTTVTTEKTVKTTGDNPPPARP